MTNKIIFFDIDSTLYKHQFHEVPVSTQKTLYKLKAAGHKIVFATSRCRLETIHLPKFIREFDFDARIYDGGALALVGDEIVHAKVVDHELATTIANLSREHHFIFRYSTFDDDFYDVAVAASVRDDYFHLYLQIPNVKRYNNDDTYNILVYTQKASDRALIMDFKEDCSITVHCDDIYEITAKGVDKSSAVKAICDYYQMSLSDAICVGDGANDVAMVQQAGIGIAMGNGDSRVKAVADFVCPSIEEDGIYHAFKTLGMIEEE